MQDEFACGSDFRRTTPGVGVLDTGYDVANSAGHGGNFARGQIFNISLIVSKDCSTWIPQGFHTNRQKRQINNSDKRAESKSRQTTDSSNFEVGVSFGAAVGSIGASVESAYSEKESVETDFSEGHEIFTSKVANIDNSLTFDFSDPPPLALGFKNKVLNLTRLSGVEVERGDADDELANMLTSFGHYVKKVELGSKYEEMRIVSKRAIAEAKKRETSLDVSASFQSTFVSGSASYGQDESFSEAKKELFEKTQVVRLQIGSNLKPNENFELTDTPGIIMAEFRPICDLISDKMIEMPVRNTLRDLRHRCRRVYKSSLFCIESLKLAESEKQMKEMWSQVRSMPQCERLPFPSFGLRLSRSESTSSLTDADVQRHDCHKRSGFVQTWSHVAQGGDSVCTTCRAHEHCDKIERCERGQSCVGSLFKIVPGTKVSLPLGTLVVGNPLKSEKINGTVSEASLLDLENLKKNVRVTEPSPFNGGPVERQNSSILALLSPVSRAFIPQTDASNFRTTLLEMWRGSLGQSIERDCRKLCEGTKGCDTYHLQDLVFDRPMKNLSHPVCKENPGWSKSRCLHENSVHNFWLKNNPNQALARCTLFNANDIYYVKAMPVHACKRFPKTCDFHDAILVGL